ncbi:MAG: M23 family metallopeptidase [Syntrophobacterales bacterium]|jgi:murein DD-endopeptidase MepM/ murein hydrolase activator NlpD|nr:M23 family metallopeptidase [Syntrophobacterales bacterium]
MKAKKRTLAIFMGITLLAAGITGLFFLPIFDWSKPEIVLTPDINTIGRSQTFNTDFATRKSALKEIRITIAQNDKEQTLADISYDTPETYSQEISLVFNPSQMELADGPARLKITAKSFSWLRSKATLTRNIVIDLIPPQIFLLNTANYINPGGTCVALFQVSKPVTEVGVFVNETFFRAYPVTVSGKPCYLSYFAIPMSANDRTPVIRAFARDMGNNETSVGIPFTLKKKRFRHDKLNISDAFLQRNMPDFQAAFPELRDKSLIDTFRHINTVMRDDNFKTIQAICKQSQPEILWQGPFLRLKDSATMSLYGDYRSWLYRGQAVGESIHEGVDLASTAQAPVMAANSGLVVFTGNLGIYGETVIIDHGMEMISLYAHLSSIHVEKGHKVNKGDTIGNTGLTGLAGGDHLHFSIMIGGQFVNPVEWWDHRWISDNVTQKTNISF